MLAGRGIEALLLFIVVCVFVLLFFVVDAAVNDGLGMLAGREIEGEALLLNPHPPT